MNSEQITTNSKQNPSLRAKCNEAKQSPELKGLLRHAKAQCYAIPRNDALIVMRETKNNKPKTLKGHSALATPPFRGGWEGLLL
jgi:hypothetical protein